MPGRRMRPQPQPRQMNTAMPFLKLHAHAACVKRRPRMGAHVRLLVCDNILCASSCATRSFSRASSLHAQARHRARRHVGWWRTRRRVTPHRCNNTLALPCLRASRQLFFRRRCRPRGDPTGTPVRQPAARGRMLPGNAKVPGGLSRLGRVRHAVGRLRTTVSSSFLNVGSALRQGEWLTAAQAPPGRGALTLPQLTCRPPHACRQACCFGGGSTGQTPTPGTPARRRRCVSRCRRGGLG